MLSYIIFIIDKLFSFIYDLRRNNELISAIKSNNIQALMSPVIKNERDDLLLFNYIKCNSIQNYPEGNKQNNKLH